MNTFDEEKWLREIAQASADALGQQVLDELAALRNRPAKEQPDTAGLDARVWDMLRSGYQSGHKQGRRPGLRPGLRAKLIRAAAALAACAAVAIALPYFLRGGVSAPSPSAEAPQPAPGYAAAPAPAPPADSIDAIPVTFTLGGRYAVEEVEQDREKTVCHIDDTMGDDVVLTMEYTQQAPGYDGFSEYNVNGYTVYGAYEADYSVLLFERDGVLYRLTCKYDLNTLLDVSKYILL